MASVTLLFVFTLTLTALAIPLPASDNSEMLVFNPHITYPNASVIWLRGAAYNVTWDTTSLPADAAGNNGVVLLGHPGNNSENLDVAHPLARDFFLRDGSVLVKVPEDVPQRKDYFVVLFGDSGNISPEFEIF